MGEAVSVPTEEVASEPVTQEVNTPDELMLHSVGRVPVRVYVSALPIGLVKAVLGTVQVYGVPPVKLRMSDPASL